MPAYTFEALDAQGQTRKGVMEAETVKAARSQLRTQALVPLKVEPVVTGASDGVGGSKPGFFAPRVFTELQNAQAIVLPYDGVNPLPPQYCYLKPHYLDVSTSYFDHLEAGAL